MCYGGDSCCTTENPCEEDRGDCDVDSDCKIGLRCGENNCKRKTGLQWDVTDDCCYSPGLVLGIFATQSNITNIYLKKIYFI